MSDELPPLSSGTPHSLVGRSDRCAGRWRSGSFCDANSGIASSKPRFLGVAPISVLRLDGETDGRYAQRLNTAVALAEGAVTDELTNDELSVASDPAQGAVQFMATGASPDEAIAAATGLRAVYLNSRPTDTAEDQLGPVLEALATEIAVVEADLSDLNVVGD